MYLLLENSKLKKYTDVTVKELHMYLNLDRITPTNLSEFVLAQLQKFEK